MLRLVSWNVNGIRACCRKGFLDWLDAQRPDILGIQETKLTQDDLVDDITAPPGYRTYWSHAEKKGYSGVAIYTREAPIEVTEGLGIARFDAEGRTLIADYGDFVLYNIYYPNGQRSDERLQYKMDFYAAFLEHVNHMRDVGKRIVVCGDFNTAHQAIDLARPKENEKVSGFLPQERAWMDAFVAAGYLDTFRLLTPEGSGHYSWWNQRSRARERNVGWRIDYFFVTQALTAHVADAAIRPEVLGSDHCPVTLNLSL
jgi:exodeoxyribonuclease-3